MNSDVQLELLAKNITSLRESMGLTREGLAEIVGCSMSHISKLEREKTSNPSYFVIQDIAIFFGLSADQLINEDVKKMSDRSLALSRIEKNFSDSEWQVLLSLVDGVTRHQAKNGKFRSHNSGVALLKK